MKPKRLKFWIKGQSLNTPAPYWVRDIVRDTSGTDYMSRYALTVNTDDRLVGLHCSIDNDKVFVVDEQVEGDTIGESIIHVTQLRGHYVR